MAILRRRLLVPTVLLLAACSDPVGPRPSPLVALVFDDNAKGVAESAFPLMAERGMVGTVFVHTCSIGRPGYMDLNRLGALQEAGWEIGAHTLTHADLTQLSPERVRHEAVGSREELEAAGFSCVSFAVPYGLVNAVVREILSGLFDIVRDSRDRCLRRPIDWHRVGMYAMHPGEHPAAAMGRLDRAVRRSEDVVILGFHGVGGDEYRADVSYPCYDAEDFGVIVDYVDRMCLRTVTLTEARRLLG
jgi:peptidoglycan/xylan/chitin deacetylase (PgdA/CDA1 family)